jgi:hypothetical protein
MDCLPVGARAEPKGPQDWGASARAIDAFCSTLFDAGYPPTLFVTPETVEQHAPLCEDVAAGGADVGLLVHPPLLRGAPYRRYLGAYDAERQEEIVRDALQRFDDVTGFRPQSVRSAMYSASDATFPLLSRLGFRQASLSNPGRRTPKFDAVWTGAATDAHYASASSRLVAGALPLLEVPVTTDATQVRGGVAPDLAIENGTLERWHAPLLAGQLERQAEEQVAFRSLCFVTLNRIPYQDRASRFRQTLDDLLNHLLELDERYEIVPATLAEAYAHFRQQEEP